MSSAAAIWRHLNHWKQALMGPLVGIGVLIWNQATGKPFAWGWFAALVAAGLALQFYARLKEVEKRNAKEVLASDPRIYFDLLDRRNQVPNCTPFRLHNRGGGVAHNILIAPVELERRLVTFAKEDSLDVGSTTEVLPQVTNMGAILKNDILNALRWEVNESAKNLANAEFFSLPMCASYTDYTGKRKFRARFVVVFYLINDALFKEGPLKDIKPRIKVENKDWTVID